MSAFFSLLNHKTPTFLIVDDEPSIRDYLRQIFVDAGLSCDTVPRWAVAPARSASGAMRL